MKSLLSLIFIGVSFFVYESIDESIREASLYSTDYFNDSLQKVYFKEIDKAEKSLFLFIYALKDYKIMKKLREKAADGIDVQVIVDQEASPFAHRYLGKDVKLIRRSGRGLMHMKILVVDQNEVVLGSANLTRDSLNSHSNLVQVISSPDLANFILEKGKAMTTMNGHEKNFPHKIMLLDNQTLEMWFLPDDKEASLHLKELIRSAKKSIKVAMYTFTRLDFAKTLIEAKNRGIDVEVILDRSQAQHTSLKVLDLLKKSTVSIFTNLGPYLLHHKMMIIDDEVLIHGSANYTKAAFTQNDDFFIVLNKLSPSQAKDVNEIWKNLLLKAAPP